MAILDPKSPKNSRPLFSFSGKINLRASDPLSGWSSGLCARFAVALLFFALGKIFRLLACS
jgi:hypothetical protein